MIGRALRSTTRRRENQAATRLPKARCKRPLIPCIQPRIPIVRPRNAQKARMERRRSEVGGQISDVGSLSPGGARFVVTRGRATKSESFTRRREERGEKKSANWRGTLCRDLGTGVAIQRRQFHAESIGQLGIRSGIRQRKVSRGDAEHAERSEVRSRRSRVRCQRPGIKSQSTDCRHLKSYF